VSGPKGNAHLTSVGVLLITEAIFNPGNKSASQNGGIYLPETIISTHDIMGRLTEFGISITEETIG
jgi:hypothetical protein